MSYRAEPRDLMHCEEIRARVRDTYAAVEDTGGAVARRFYSADDLAQVPSIAADGALGVADHLRHADIKPGETILDIGCGSGLDTILAARRTGPTGRLLALDFLPAMLERTSAAAAEARLLNVETVQAEMEAIPLPDDSIDQIISNGVINLSPRKARVLAECARVLRPGGKLCVADMTVDEEQLPEQVLAHPAAWTSCTTGALTERDFVRKLEKAGFNAIEVVQREPLSVDDCALYPVFTPELLELMTKLIPPHQQTRIVTAIVAKARLNIPT